MALQQQQSTEEQSAEPVAAADDGRRSFDIWQHTTMLGADDSDGPPEDNVIRGID
jgi:hypothetical protein